MYTVYILKCKGGGLYTGIAKNLALRLHAHTNINGSRYVRAHLPFELVYTETRANRSLATKREMQIKKMTREKKLELISQNHE